MIFDLIIDVLGWILLGAITLWSFAQIIGGLRE